MSFSLIPAAYAAEAAPAGGDMSMMIVLVMCMLAVYFFVCARLQKA